ncbi:MAG TPA: methylated-DNA--[protein]-cysteine S-methyltransferase [Pseudonocardia sp.]
MQLSWTVMPAPGPIGALTVGATDDGLALVAFGEQPESAARAADRLGLQAVAREPVDAVSQLREYLDGERTVFDLPLDWSLTHGSQRKVLETLHATVGYGDTVTYGELAARASLGSAYTAARGVGAIMGSNPLPVVVACHRVLAADGLGGFGGGRATKEWLLALEGVLTGTFDFSCARKPSP